MSATKDIITVTSNPAIDSSSKVDQVVANKKLRCTKPLNEPGGGGINVARALKKLGYESTAIYTEGGTLGKMLNHLLEKEEINTNPVRIKNISRLNFTISERNSDRQFRFVFPGASVSSEEESKLLDSVRDAKIVIGSGSLPPDIGKDFYAKLSSRGSKIGAKTIIDTSGDSLRSLRETKTYLIKTNMREFKQLIDMEPKNEDERNREARKLVEKGVCEILIISLGAAGALMFTKNDFIRIRSPEVNIKSRVGAGDSMVAGIAAGLHEKWSMKKVLKMGVAAGAAAVMTPGSELCKKEDTYKLFQKSLETK